MEHYYILYFKLPSYNYTHIIEDFQKKKKRLKKFETELWFQVCIFCQPSLLYQHPHVLSLSLIVRSSPLPLLTPYSPPSLFKPFCIKTHSELWFPVRMLINFSIFNFQSSQYVWLFEIQLKPPFVLVFEFCLSLLFVWTSTLWFWSISVFDHDSCLPYLYLRTSDFLVLDFACFGLLFCFSFWHLESLITWLVYKLAHSRVVGQLGYATNALHSA